MEKYTDLLEAIKELAGYEYVSDLRRPVRGRRVRIAAVIEEIEKSRYSLGEWKEAAHYITGTYLSFENTEEAIRFLKDELQK